MAGKDRKEPTLEVEVEPAPAPPPRKIPRDPNASLDGFLAELDSKDVSALVAPTPPSPPGPPKPPKPGSMRPPTPGSVAPKAFAKPSTMAPPTPAAAAPPPKAPPPGGKPPSIAPPPRAAPPSRMATPGARPAAPPPTPHGLAPPTPAMPAIAPAAPAPSAKATSPGAAVAPSEVDDGTRALLESWERELHATSDRLKQAKLHYEIGALAEARLRDLKIAGQHYQEALARAPEHVPSIRGARRVHLLKKQMLQAIPLFDAEARLLSDPKAKAALLLEKGRVHEDLLGQRAEARAAYAAAYELDKTEPAILRALAQIDEAAGKYDDLAVDLEREAAAVASDPRHRAALLVARARILELKQKDPEAAIDVYDAALKLDPQATGALEALKRLLSVRKRWADLVRVLELDAAQTESDVHEARTLARVGRIHAERLGSPDDALAAFERAQAAAPDEPEVLVGLATIYEDAGRGADLARVLDRQVAAAAPAEKLSLLQRIGTIRRDELDDVAGAQAAWEGALSISPVHLPTLQALGRLYAETSQHGKLVAMLLAEVDACEEPRRRAACLARVAEIEEVHRKNVERAIEHHARALTIVPGHPPSFKALVRLFAGQKRWRELAELQLREAEAQKAPEKAIEHLLEAALVFEHGLSDPLQAAHTYRRILALDKKHLPALWALQRTTERSGRWAEHVAALEDEAALATEPARQIALHTRAGEVLETELEDRDGAVIRYRRALELDPKHGGVLSALGRLYHALGRHEDLLDVYRRELELSTGAVEAAALLCKMGEIAEKKAGKEDEAIALYRRAIEKDPTNGAALRALEKKLRALGRFKEMVEVLDVELVTLTEPGPRARLLVRMAEICEERLGQLDRAVSLYEAAREADPGHVAALDALARLRVHEAAYKKLADDHEREAARLESDPAAISALAAAAMVYADHLGEPRRAAAAWEKILEREPGHVAALLALEPLYRRLGAHEPLAKILAAEARSFADPVARAGALRELARLDDTRLGRATGAYRAAVEAVLTIVPDDTLALGTLERVALETGDGALLSAVDAKLASRAGDPAAEAAYRVRLAAAVEGKDPARAKAELEKAVEVDKASLAAARGLSRLAERMHEPKALAAALRHEASLLEDRKQAASLLVRAGDIGFHDLGDARLAVPDHERALELDPESADAAGRLLELLLAGGEAGRAVDRLSAAATAAKGERAIELWSEVARLQADVLESVPAAIASLQRVTKIQPGHVPTLRRLAALYLRESAWAEAAQLFARIVSLAPDRDALKEAHLELSAIYERTDERPRARVSILAVLAMEPQNRLALGRLSTIELRDGQVEKAIEAQRRRVAASISPDDRAQALAFLADLEERRGRKDLATDALAEATSIEGHDGPAAKRWKERLEKLEGDERLQGWARYAQALSKFVESAPAILPARIELSTILGDVLGRHGDAAQVLRLAMRQFPDALEIRRHLVARLARAGQGAEAFELARRVAEEVPSRPEVWRDLRSVLGPETQISQLAIAPLVLLGAAKPDELDTWRSRRPVVAPFRPGAFSIDLLSPLAGLDPTSPLLGILGALPEAAVKLWPLDLESFGVSAREKITARSGHPLRALSDRVAAIFGIPEHDLYVHRLRGKGVVTELTEPVTVLLPQGALELGEPAQAFLLARAFAAAALRTSLVDKLTPRELEVFVASSVRSLSPGYGAGLTSEDVLEDQSRRIQKSLSRRPRRQLEENASRYVAGPSVDFATFAKNAALGTARAALLVSDDLVQAVEVLRRTERDLASIDPATVVRTVPLVTDLVRFWASDTAISARRRLATIA